STPMRAHDGTDMSRSASAPSTERTRMDFSAGWVFSRAGIDADIGSRRSQATPGAALERLMIGIHLDRPAEKGAGHHLDAGLGAQAGVECGIAVANVQAQTVRAAIKPRVSMNFRRSRRG